MALTKDIRKRLDVPHEPGAWVEIRMLSWLRLDEAQRKRIAAVTEVSRAISSEELTRLAAEMRAGGAFVKRDRVLDYDRATLFRGGIVAWSYGDYGPDLADELDERTADWLAHEILDYALPTEAQVKTDSSPSIGI